MPTDVLGLFNLFSIPPVIKVEIPALSEYVDFLKDQRELQQTLDALDDQLDKSTIDLESAVKNNQRRT